MRSAVNFSSLLLRLRATYLVDDFGKEESSAMTIMDCTNVCIVESLELCSINAALYSWWPVKGQMWPLAFVEMRQS